MIERVMEDTACDPWSIYLMNAAVGKRTYMWNMHKNIPFQNKLNSIDIPFFTIIPSLHMAAIVNEVLSCKKNSGQKTYW